MDPVRQESARESAGTMRPQAAQQKLQASNYNTAAFCKEMSIMDTLLSNCRSSANLEDSEEREGERHRKEKSEKGIDASLTCRSLAPVRGRESTSSAPFSYQLLALLLYVIICQRSTTSKTCIETMLRVTTYAIHYSQDRFDCRIMAIRGFTIRSPGTLLSHTICKT